MTASGLGATDTGSLAAACNRVRPIKADCTDSDTGRELERRVRGLATGGQITLFLSSESLRQLERKLRHLMIPDNGRSYVLSLTAPNAST